jgi:hypothetical protein
MLAPRIYAKAREIDRRLVSFPVTRQELMKVVLGVVAARADTVENDPITAEGQLAYIYGTRFLRSLFRSKGYFLYRKDNIEGVNYPERELKIIYQSVDLAADCWHIPKAISGKGPAANRIINSAQGNLFTEEQLAAVEALKFDEIDTGVWYFCVSVDGDDVRAELSLPTRIAGDNFKGFIERIFIVREGKWRGLAAKLGAGAAAEFEPIVTRK